MFMRETALAAKVEFVVLKARILPRAAREGDDRDDDLGGEENHPEVHASAKGIWSATGQVVETKLFAWVTAQAHSVSEQIFMPS